MTDGRIVTSNQTLLSFEDAVESVRTTLGLGDGLEVLDATQQGIKSEKGGCGLKELGLEKRCWYSKRLAQITVKTSGSTRRKLHAEEV